MNQKREKPDAMAILLLSAGMLITAVLLAVTLFTSTVQAKPASVLLQEGLYAEEVEGNLDAAIEIYQKAVKQAARVEKTAARATYRIGMCYLKKGEKEKAADYFEQITTKFGQQKALAQRAQSQLEKLRPLVNQTFGFGPVRRVTLYDIDHNSTKDKDRTIDLDTGRLLKIPAAIYEKGDEEGMKWLADNGVDAIAEITETDDRGLITFGMAIEMMPPHVWDMLGPLELQSLMFGKRSGNQETTPIPFEGNNYRPVFAFRTREGGLGILQLISVEPAAQKVEFRYKMLQDQGTGADVGVSSRKAMQILPVLKGLFGGVIEALENDDIDTALMLTRQLIDQSQELEQAVRGTEVEASIKTGRQMLVPLREALKQKDLKRAKSFIATLNAMGPGIENLLIEQSKTKSDIDKRDALDVASAFLAAVISGGNSGAIALVKPGSAVVNQVRDFQKISNIGELKLVAMYTTNQFALGVTNKIKIENEQGQLLFHLVKNRGIWMVDDIDLENPDSLKDEINSFLKRHTDAEKVTPRQDQRVTIAQVPDPRTQSPKSLSRLGKAMAIYANDDERGRHADNLRLIWKGDYLNMEDVKWLSENAEYLGKGKTAADSPKTILAYDKTMLQAGKGTNVLFLDTHVEFVKPDRLKKLGIKVAPGEATSFETTIYDNSSLDLEIGADVSITGKTGKVPSYHDVAWDNDGGGALMVIPDSGTRIIALANATNLKEALNTARASMDLLRKSESKGVLAKQSKCVAVLTGQGNLAAIEITRYDSEKGTIEWMLVKAIDENVESRNNLHQLAIALWIYADDHNLKMPENLNEVKSNIPNENVFRWVLDNVQYINQGTRTKDTDAPTAYDKTLLEKGNGTNVLFMDASVKFFDTQELERMGIKTTSTKEPTVSSKDKRAAENLSANGWQLWGQRKLAEAQKVFERAVGKDPGNANAWNGLGWSQFNQGKNLKAKG